MEALRLAGTYAAQRLRGVRFNAFEPMSRPTDVSGDGVGGLVRQVRLSLRALLRSPGFTAPALFILAAGLASATAIFTVVDSIAFRPLDLPDANRLVIVCEDHPRLEGYCISSPINAEDFRRASSTLAELGIGRGWPFILTDDQGSEGVRGGLASAGFLRALGVRPEIGRIFYDDETGPDNDKVALISHAFWTSRYGADPRVLGTVVRLNDASFDIVGVLPAGFDLPLDLGGIDVWTPPYFAPLDPEQRGWRGFRAIGRLADDASVASAADELKGVYAGLADRYEEIDDEWRLRVAPLLQVVVGDTRPVLMAFLGAAGVLLLIVCANVANLLLVRGLNRQRELAVRAALGAARRRLLAEILVEGLVLTGVATAAAVPLAGLATRALLSLAPPWIPRLDEVGMDGRVLAFASAVAVVSTLAFTILPGLRVTRWDLGRTLKAGAREGVARGSVRLQHGLVVTELALATILLGSAALLTRSFAQYLRWEPGFDRESLIAVSAFADIARYPTRAAFMGMFRQGEERIAALRGVASVATASAGPLFGGGDGATPFALEGADETGPLPSAEWYDVGPGYFATLGLPIVRGREITEADGPDVELAAVVNEAFARAASQDGDVVGKLVHLPDLEATVRIVGVVADVTPLTPGAPPPAEIYWSNRQRGRPFVYFLVRAAAGRPEQLAAAVTDALHEVDPDLSLGTPGTLAAQADRELVRPRFQAVILVVFALGALLLSAVGVYAVVSYAAARRVREVGIRMALGAAAGDVVALVSRSSMVVASIGVAIGVAGAAVVGLAIRSLIPGVSPTDPWSLGGAAGVLLLAAGLATFVPARRAARADPLTSIRAE